MLDIVIRLPYSDAYVFETEMFKANKQSKNMNTYATLIQKTLIFMLNCTSINKPSVDHGQTTRDDDVTSTLRSAVYFMKTSLTSNRFQLAVGHERADLSQVVDDVIAGTHAQASDVTVRSYPFGERFRSASAADKQCLGACLLSATTFYKTLIEYGQVRSGGAHAVTSSRQTAASAGAHSQTASAVTSSAGCTEQHDDKIITPSNGNGDTEINRDADNISVDPVTSIPDEGGLSQREEGEARPQWPKERPVTSSNPVTSPRKPQTFAFGVQQQKDDGISPHRGQPSEQRRMKLTSSTSTAASWIRSRSQNREDTTPTCDSNNSAEIRGEPLDWSLLEDAGAPKYPRKMPGRYIPNTSDAVNVSWDMVLTGVGLPEDDEEKDVETKVDSCSIKAEQTTKSADLKLSRVLEGHAKKSDNSVAPPVATAVNKRYNFDICDYISVSKKGK